MTQGTQILKSKLSLPHDSGIVNRTRLHPLLEEIRARRLTVVTAGAGYGKTTLIAEAVRLLKLKVVWYRLDKSDRDLFTVIVYLIEGIRAHEPAFGKKTELRMETAEYSSLGREAVLKALVMELESVKHTDLTIVFDDLYFIDSSLEIRESMAFLIENAPRSVHFIFISRTDPAFSLSRYRAGRELLDIGEPELAFSLDETRFLYKQLFQVTLQEDKLKTLHSKTEGWISGLILFYNSLRGKSEEKATSLLEKLKGSQKIIARFLEENVYDIQPDGVKDFLKQTAILSRVGPEFCDSLLGITNSSQLLEQLEDKHLFTFPFDEDREWFYYHHLFQDFLKSKLHTDLDDNSIRQLHKRAAQVWEQFGEWEEAMEHYVQAKEFDSVCALLVRLGQSSLARGRIQLIISIIERIPETFLDSNPWVHYNYGRALELSGNRTQAVDVFNRAMQNFSRQNQAKGARVCLYALGSSHYLAGDFRKADQMLRELLEKIENNPRFAISILGSLVFIASHQGRMETADQYFNMALVMIPETQNRDVQAWLYFNQGFRYCFAGDFNKALEFGYQVDEICKREKLSYTQVFNYHLISWSLYYLGRYQGGAQYARKGMEKAKNEGYQDTSYAWLLSDLALNSIGLGNATDAIEYTRSAIRIFKEQGSVWGETWAYHILYDACKADGCPEDAELHLNIGIELLKNMHLPLQEGMLKKRLAERTLSRQEWQVTQSLLRECEKAFHTSSLYLATTHLCSARLHWKRSQQTAAVKKLQKALTICKNKQYDHIIAAEKDWIGPLLLKAYNDGVMKDYVEKTLSQSDFDGLRELKKDQPPARSATDDISPENSRISQQNLRILCMGEFRLFKDDEEIGQHRWKSKKALMLFKYLIHSRLHGYVHKEVLIDLMWPDISPHKASSRLYDALSALRKTLEPEKKGTARSSYLKREAGSYKLCIGKGGTVDVEAFKSLVKQPSDADAAADTIEGYLAAEALYRGDFLEEDRFSQWCEEERERLKNDYLNLLENIMTYYEKERQHEKCIEFGLKYIKKDKYAEHIYQRLMHYYAFTKNRSMLSKTYENCRKSMLEGLDQPVSSETERLYRRLKSR